jgi:hypothetical protein
MKEQRTTFAVCRILRETLASPMFPPGEYKPSEIMERMIMAGLLHPWEFTPSNTREQALQVGWTSNGKSANGSRLIKPVPVLAPVQPLAEAPGPLFDDPDHRPGRFARKIARVELMLETIMVALGVPVPEKED